MRVPPLETERLIIRPFTMDDLEDVHQMLDVDLVDVDFGSEGEKALHERQQWLQWTVMSYEELAKLYQPPYGERAVTLKETGQLIGACGFVPCLNVFEQLPSFSTTVVDQSESFNSTEFGLYYALSPAHQRQGYATEAVKAMIDYAFTELNLRRIVATTTYDNVPSIGVMQKVGMRIEKNPFADPPWLQVVGILDNTPSDSPDIR